MGICPEGHTLERIDVNGDYEPSNCRWATVLEQRRNMRSNTQLKHNGKVQCVSAWADELGINVKTIRSRLRAGWSVARTLTTGTRNNAN